MRKKGDKILQKQTGFGERKSPQESPNRDSEDTGDRREGPNGGACPERVLQEKFNTNRIYTKYGLISV